MRHLRRIFHRTGGFGRSPKDTDPLAVPFLNKTSPVAPKMLGATPLPLLRPYSARVWRGAGHGKKMKLSGYTADHVQNTRVTCLASSQHPGQFTL